MLNNNDGNTMLIYKIKSQPQSPEGQSRKNNEVVSIITFQFHSILFEEEAEKNCDKKFPALLFYFMLFHFYYFFFFEGVVLGGNKCFRALHVIQRPLKK